jgi:hypothetical protein
VGEDLGCRLVRSFGGSNIVKSKNEGKFNGSKDFGMTIMNAVNTTNMD